MHEAVVNHKKRGTLFHCASAQDLRCLDMEKEKQDASSPRGVLEAYATAFESDAVTPENGSLELESRPTSRAVSHWRNFFKLWNKRSIKRLASFPPLGVPKFPRRKCKNERESPLLTNVYNFKSSLVNFTFSELQTATNNFSDENLIGKGGYAKVYRGCLRNGQLIAVKRLIKGTADEKTAAFLSELGIIAHVDHPNTAKLFGCCIEGGMHLVFQLSSFGSLGSLLHGSKDNKLDWRKRYKIALGTADGLLYLHESCQRRIIHRDIKADNILLTQDYEAQVYFLLVGVSSACIIEAYEACILQKLRSYACRCTFKLEAPDDLVVAICDFGLAKWLPEQLTHHNVSKFEGTFGYFAPEYFMHGIVDEKTDVYSFGVLLLELITGRRALDHLQQSLVIWSKPLLDDNNIKELVDPSLGDKYDPEEIDRVVLTASLCIEQSPILRPRMSQVVILLRGDEYVAECAKECRKISLQRTYSEELLDAEEYNSTKYLSDLNRHKQVAFSS